MPNALLARYFQGRDVLDHLNFTTMKDTQPDELFMAWLSLPDDKRKGMDAEFQDIFEMSCEKGFRAILDEAEWHLRTEPEALTEFVESLAALANHYERAMITFLDHAPFWKGATINRVPVPIRRLEQWQVSFREIRLRDSRSVVKLEAARKTVG
jgi:hypothetical protein